MLYAMYAYYVTCSRTSVLFTGIINTALALISARAEGSHFCALYRSSVCVCLHPLQIQTSSGYEPCALTCVVVGHSCAHLYHHRRRTPSTLNPCKLPCSQPTPIPLSLAVESSAATLVIDSTRVAGHSD